MNLREFIMKKNKSIIDLKNRLRYYKKKNPVMSNCVEV